MRRGLSFVAAVAAAALLAGCPTAPEPEPEPETDAPPACPELPCELLSEYGFFEGDLRDVQPAAGVVPYAPIAPLWSDGADKERFLVVPEGTSIGFDPGELWDWPAGSILVKHFAFADPVETRLLLLGDDGWTGEVYLWNEDHTDAERFVAGTRVDVEGPDGPQEYVVPNTNACRNCHERDDEMHLLGPFTAQLPHELERLADLGLFDVELPDPATLDAFVDPLGDAPIDARARSYLHANCSHCHRPGGNAAATGLVFLEWETDPVAYGVCKRPVAAGGGTGGREFDIVPGDPDASIVVFRMESTEPGIMMPELPNLLPDPEGVALIREWIAQMPPEECE